VRVKGAVHVHSDLSHDGKLSLAEVASFYRAHKFNFVAIGEHSQDVDAARIAVLIAECDANSDTAFRMIPGIEFTCNNGMHILGVGVTQLSELRAPVEIAGHIRRQQGYAVLAHPTRFGWKCDPEILRAVDAVEIWNVGYDGKYVPSVDAARNFAALRQSNPTLHAIVSHDLHFREAFYNVAVEMELPELTAAAIISCLRAGEYCNVSSLFQLRPQAEYAGPKTTWLRLVGQQRDRFRKMRAMILRWSQ
jgi:hypothetical protein